MESRRYHIGLDIGTSSIGYAVMDDNFKLMRAKGKTMIGTYLFTEGQTAADRRGFRTARRRLSRRRWRLSLLENFFAPHMEKLDPMFFKRLKESRRTAQEKRTAEAGTILFPKQGDAAFYKKYPTIYHLRYALMNEKRKFDLREIFLAAHHIVKYRGNFLYSTPVDRFSSGKVDFDTAFASLNDLYAELNPLQSFKLVSDEAVIHQLSDLFLSDEIKTIDKQRQAAKLLAEKNGNKEVDKANKKIATEISKALLGYNAKFDCILQQETDDSAAWKINFSDEDIDDKLAALTSNLTDQQQAILTQLSHLYSKIALNEIVPGGISLSESMINKYDLHSEHLKLLKAYAHTLALKDKRKLMEAYTGYVGKQGVKHLDKDDFYKAVKKYLDNSQDAQEIKSLIDEDNFMPKQRTSDNSVIPHQLHQQELDRIIANQAQYYPWLAELNPNPKRKHVAKYKLDELVAFRIPYYIGPLITLNDQKKTSGKDFAWMVRKEDGNISPWNFDQKVDREASANAFIKRMTTKDTYLLAEDVLPAASLIYERFKVLNELNMMRLNGHRLDVGMKQDIFENLFKKQKTISVKKLINYLEVQGNIKPEISGLSDPAKFNNSLGTYIDLKKILGTEVDNKDRQQDLERIIEWSTVFEDNKIYALKLKEIGWLTDQQRKQLARKRYTGWGKLSAKLLTGLKNERGESILDLMWKTKSTFMEVQSQPEFKKLIAAENEKHVKQNSVEEILDEAYTSPQNKKAIWKVLQVIADIQAAMHGQAPASIALEFAREDDVSKRTVARKNTIQSAYSKIAAEIASKYDQKSLTEELDKCTDINDRLYLYFTQLGRDMYTGEKINIEDISRNYDIDHILPQSFIKNDSLDNRVLVNRKTNIRKSDTVPGKQFSKMRSFWMMLKNQGLISTKKYNNLMSDPDEISKFQAKGFVNRQLVETRQVIKLVANILGERYVADGTEILEVKAALTHQMRKLKDYHFIKNRNVNDYHHAFDGYLTTFVGQYLYRRYPKLRAYFVYGDNQYLDDHGLGRLKSFNFLHDLENQKGSSDLKIADLETGEVLTREELLNQLNHAYHFKFMPVVHEVYSNSGAMFNMTIYPKPANDKKKRKLIPIKEGLDPQLYGGYSGSADAYMAIIRENGRKPKFRIVGVPVRAANKVRRAQKKDSKAYKAAVHQALVPAMTKKKKDRKTGKKVAVVKDFDVLVPRVLYRQLVIDGDQKFLVGSSTYQYNAKQLVLSQKSLEVLDSDWLKEHRLDADLSQRLIDVYDEILDAVDKYLPLYDKNKFRQGLRNGREKFIALPDFSKVENHKKVATGKVEVLNNILLGLHDNPVLGDLKVLGIKTPFGKLQNPSGTLLSPDAELVYQSPTGLFERRVKISELN